MEATAVQIVQKTAWGLHDRGAFLVGLMERLH